MSRRKGKRGLVELFGASSTPKGNAPIIFRSNYNLNKDYCVYRSLSFNNDNDSYFCYEGMLNEKRCSFKIDTGSDISIVNRKLVKDYGEKLETVNCFLRYPTGEKILCKNKILVDILIGKYSLKIPMFVAEIHDDCLLGVDFLKKVSLENVFESAFGNSKSKKEKNFNCSRVVSVPSVLRELIEKNSENLVDSQKEVFAGLLNEFQDIFSEEIIAGNCDIICHSINVEDSPPIKQVPRRIPYHMRDEVYGIIEEMKKHGVIEESQSPWVSPAVLVRKKNGALRFCVDFRKLNAVTIKDSFPLPRIDDIFDQLSGNVWFTTLDLKSGYWQVKIRPEDREKTAFSVGKGLWQFTVMPFGLCNAPATFQRLMEKILKDMLTKICLVYLDDVIIFGKSFEEMLENLSKVFRRIREANLRINPEKCVFFRKNVKYLGHIISAEGVVTDPEKISAVKDWPVPHTKKQLRSFLGFCSYYRKFVKGFSFISKPLYALTEDKVKFSWGEECQNAFDELKRVLSFSPMLSFPREEEKFILDTDASNIGIGAVLSQKQDGKERVIAYFSRVLNKAERNYCVTRRELLAIVEAIKAFRHYLLGQKFLIRTDHVSLRWLLSFRDLEGQLARWLERLQQFEFEIVFRKGQFHGNADGLSRRHCESQGCRYCAKIEENCARESRKTITLARITLAEENLEEWQREQKEDPSLSVIFRGKETGVRPLRTEVSDVSTRIYLSYWDVINLKNGVLYKSWYAPNLKSSFLQLLVPRKRVKEILEKAHDSLSGGHFGVNKTLEKIRKRFYWASCKQDVEDWCKSCEVCVARKGPLGKGKSPLQIFNVGTPFERVQMDILGPFPITSSGNKYLLVVVDCFTKWVEAFPLRNIRAKTVAEVFVNQIVSRHGTPFEVHTDQGRNFESKLFTELMELLGIRKTRTTALHPQSDGQVERQHQTITNYLAKYISSNQKDWDRWIPMFLLAYRTSKHEATGVTPAELYFARDLRLPLDLLRGKPPESCKEDPHTAEGFVKDFQRKMEGFHASVKERLDIRSSRVKSRYDRRARHILFQEGQKVWFFNPRRVKGKAPKLQSDWEGPYFIVRKLSEVVYCIQKTPKHRRKIVHSDRLAPFYERKLVR